MSCNYVSQRPCETKTWYNLHLLGDKVRVEAERITPRSPAFMEGAD